MDINTARDLRTAYLHTFDAFATDPVTLADAISAIGNPRYARELLAVLVDAGLVIQDQVNGGDDVWQAAETYDSISRDEAVSVIDTWLASQGVEQPTEKPAAKKASKPKADANPADLPNCTCGCGAVIGRKSLYKPGHDARHAGNVARAIADSGDFALLSALPSEKLQDKAGAMAERLIEKAVAKSEPKAKDEPVADLENGPSENDMPAGVDVRSDEPKAKPAPRKSAPRKSRAAKNAEKAAAK